MSLDKYVQHMRQKYSIAVAIAVIKSKPPNQTIEQYLEVLRNKLKSTDKMDEDELNISLSSEDFAMDDDETSDERMQTHAAFSQTQHSKELTASPTLLGDFNFDVIINEQRLEKTDSLGETLEVLKEIDKGCKTPLEPQPSTSQQLDYINQLPENCTEISIPNCFRPNIDKKHTNIDTNQATFYDSERSVDLEQKKRANDLKIYAEKQANQQINNAIGEMDLERNYVDTQSTFLDTERIFLNTQETYMDTQETQFNTQELDPNSQHGQGDTLNTKHCSLDFSQQFTHVSQSQSEDSRFKLLEMYIIGGNKTVKPPPNKNKITPKAVEPAQFVAKDDKDSASKDTRDVRKTYTDSNTSEPNMISKRLYYTEEQKELSLRADQSVNNLDNNNKLLNTENDITMTAEEVIHVHSKITVESSKTMLNRRNTDNDTTITQEFTNINNKDKDTTIEFTNINSEDILEGNTQTENVLPFKIIEELNRIKTLMLRRNERRLSTDGYSTDSGFVSDSQIKSSFKSSFHCSESGLNQSAHCLFNYLMTCQYNANNLEITTEISDVLSELVDSLHNDEVYPPFLDEVLDNIKTLLDDVSENNTPMIQKDETIHRLLLLNKSLHIITYTIEQITDILEKFHTNITSTENLYEISNLDQTENLCHIFHILDGLIQRYDRKNLLFSSQNSSQNSQDKVLKRNCITDIWKKKWNPDFKKRDIIDSPFRKRVLNSKISDILNKIVVDCMDGYSLVSYAALQCFNLLQS